MEHIRKALEQAERERADNIQQQAEAHPAAGDSDASGDTFPEAANNGVSGAPVAAELKPQRHKFVDISADVYERNRLVAALPKHPLADSFRMLRTRVLQQLQANGWRTLAITSAGVGSGKTLTAINLAISLAREVSSTVLLVDLDLRSPSIHEYFEYLPDIGISDYLRGDTPISEMQFSPGIERLSILPGRESLDNSSETIRSPKMVNLVTELKNRYADRIVIFDLPPMLATDDALAFAPYVDAMLMVAAAGNTSREDLQQALEVLRDVPLIGTVLNKSRSKPRQYYGRR